MLCRKKSGSTANTSLSLALTALQLAVSELLHARPLQILFMSAFNTFVAKNADE